MFTSNVSLYLYDGTTSILNSTRVIEVDNCAMTLTVSPQGIVFKDIEGILEIRRLAYRPIAQVIEVAARVVQAGSIAFTVEGCREEPVGVFPQLLAQPSLLVGHSGSKRPASLISGYHDSR